MINSHIYGPDSSVIVWRLHHTDKPDSSAHLRNARKKVIRGSIGVRDVYLSACSGVVTQKGRTEGARRLLQNSARYCVRVQLLVIFLTSSYSFSSWPVGMRRFQ